MVNKVEIVRNGMRWLRDALADAYDRGVVAGKAQSVRRSVKGKKVVRKKRKARVGKQAK